MHNNMCLGSNSSNSSAAPDCNIASHLQPIFFPSSANFLRDPFFGPSGIRAAGLPITHVDQGPGGYGGFALIKFPVSDAFVSCSFKAIGKRRLEDLRTGGPLADSSQTQGLERVSNQFPQVVWQTQSLFTDHLRKSIVLEGYVAVPVDLSCIVIDGSSAGNEERSRNLPGGDLQTAREK